MLDRKATRAEVAWVTDRWHASPLRSMRRFAEEEYVVPEGPYRGWRFRCSRQPCTGLWFDAVDSGLWNVFVATGPSQASKTTACYIIPTMYHLFEIGETVIAGVPMMEMAADKWARDILPAIEASAYKDLLPRSGPASRGGRVESIRFRNGATLKFMSGGGSDKRRAGYSARVVVITETDDMDESGGNSVEADKITQIEARTRAYGSRRRIYKECTVSTKDGHTWRGIKGGTDSRIALPCPHCRAYVTPERKHLRGWEGAENIIEARKRAHFVCPECEHPWTERQRRIANEKAVLLHGDQTAEPRRGGARIVGDLPPTDTLGFRWSAINNLFLEMADVGADLWNAQREPDEDNAERKLCQFVFATPYKPSLEDVTPLDVSAIVRRTKTLGRGVVPEDAEFVTGAVDIGKYLAHYAMIAWRPGATGHVCDYGQFEVPTDELGVEKALLVALRGFRDRIIEGFPSVSGSPIVPKQVWIDAGWQGQRGSDVIYRFCKESGERFRPSLGRGHGHNLRAYTHPTRKGTQVRFVGEQYHVTYHKADRINVVIVNADHWKSWVHDRLTIPTARPGAMTLFSAERNEHLKLAKHLTAERQVEEFTARGRVIRWVREHRQNHWFDTFYNACAAGHLCGARLIETEEHRPSVQQTPATADAAPGHWSQDPGGRPYLVTER